LIVDAETGFGNAVNVTHCVRVLEQAGASAIQIEDQDFPKKCGHFAGKEVIGASEMEGKVRAAVDARRNGTLVIARTDALAVEGLDGALERAERYIEAGADITFVEAPNSLQELATIPRRLKAPQILNIVLGGLTPVIDAKTASRMGFSILLYANAALQGAIAGMQAALKALQTGKLEESSVASFAERQRLVGKGAFDAIEARYAD
jgi:2-methylisocitrate lyase-like PEP mutase family enzyme